MRHGVVPNVAETLAMPVGLLTFLYLVASTGKHPHGKELQSPCRWSGSCVAWLLGLQRTIPVHVGLCGRSAQGIPG